MEYKEVTILIIGNFLYRKRQAMFPVLHRLYNYCWVASAVNWNTFDKGRKQI